MLMGETTHLPVYQVILNGSLKDVMVIDYVTGIIKQLFPDINIKLAMDKGFYSAKNLNCMKDDNNPKEWRFQFLIAVPFTTGFAKQLVSEGKDSIDRIENTIKLPEGTLRGVHKLCDWTGIGELHTFVYLNPKTSLQVKDDLFAYVKELMEAAESNPEDPVRKKEFDKYLLITKDKNTGSYSTSINYDKFDKYLLITKDKNTGSYSMSINYDKVNEELETVGSMVLLSNYIDKPKDAIRIYRNKNFVEKGFDKMKNSLGMERLYLHSDERAESKMFCSFIALILECAFDRVLDENDLHKKYTIKKLILELSHIKYGEVLGKKVIAPLSKEQRNIFKVFEMKAPATVNRKAKA